LAEREVLLHSAPHLIWPLRFVLPQQAHVRPNWLVRTGLALYDNLYRSQSLPRSKSVNLQTSNFGEPLLSYFKKGCVYSDCWVDDARLVIANALCAQNHGAEIHNYTPIHKLEVKNDIWHANDNIRARAVVNATGPWIGNFGKTKPRLVKGSHIVVPRRYAGDQAYILQNNDKRVVFVIPFEQEYELIGTTEVDYQGDPGQAKISDEEIHYLLDIYNRTFHHKISKQDIIWDYAGVRPLLADEKANATGVTREYKLQLQEDQGAPCLYVFGGKITNYRRLAEHAMSKLKKFFPQMQKSWTADAQLPGGEIENISAFYDEMERQYAWLPAALCDRYVRLYGTRMQQLLTDMKTLEDLGKDYGAGLYAAEINFLKQYEWAREADDILFRRTKLGLHLPLDSL
jgi:glycerol-3-phosphate dehydrogenase